jgi:hypothetical protein
MNSTADFQAFLLLSQTLKSWSKVWGTGASLRWTLWIDPGTHTGLAAVLYARPAPGDTAEDLAPRLQAAMIKAGIGQKARIGLPGPAEDPGAPGLTDTVLIGIHTELLHTDERQMARVAVGRVRQLGKAFCGGPWDTFLASPEDMVEGFGLGGAGVGAEMFFNLRAERSPEYLSPVRVRSMFAYALEDELGLDMKGQTSGDALNTFSDVRLKGVDLYIPGPDHERAALAHTLLAIRKEEA